MEEYRCKCCHKTLEEINQNLKDEDDILPGMLAILFLIIGTIPLIILVFP